MTFDLSTEHQMDEPTDRPEQATCPGCGRPNAVDSDFCAACGAPLSWHATTDPYQTIFTEGYAARRALSQPSNPIIVVGVWLWMVPLALVSSAGLVFVIASFLYGLSTFQFRHIFTALLGAIPTSVGLYISLSLLHRVTRKDRQSTGTHSADQIGSAAGTGTASDRHQSEQGEDGETLVCLGCGQQIPKGATRCLGCGWSYTEEDEGDSGAEVVR